MNAKAEKVIKALKSRNFDAYYFDDCEDAAQKIISLVPKEHQVSWGGSKTLTELGIQEKLAAAGYNLLDRDKAASPEERLEIMRRALLCDTYLTGTNAISEDGWLVNIDGNGNRAAAMIYGPKQVIIAAGINKVAKNHKDALCRARNIAAPLNIKRFPNLQPPCSKNGKCADCLSPDTICSFFVSTRFCKPAGRIKIVLIGKTLGF
ncbi:MAG: lactate utilization protein [Treponema sp.]|nr:lactate utilization protein [Treponema sp.]MCL2237145.1 lactate utilization protein [Treponema sp.]